MPSPHPPPTGPDGPDPIDRPEDHLDGLGDRFMRAMELLQKGDQDRAAEILRGILAVEPRLAEPHLEIARILLDGGQLREARAEAEEGLRLLEAKGQWLEDLPEPVLLGLAHGLLAEILRQIADTDEVVFGDPQVFRGLTRLARRHFAKAAALDPENHHASYHAFFLGVGQQEEDAGEGTGEDDQLLG
jgi:tetratricopeptide (TPR) repeat protein